MKRCKTCKQLKNELDFSTDKRSFDKLCSSCRECIRIYNRAYRKKRYLTDPQYRERVLKHAKENAKKNPSVSRKASKKWYEKNRLKKLAYEKNRYNALKQSKLELKYKVV